MRYLKIAAAIIALACISTVAEAQVPVEKSQKVISENGRSFYEHLVQPGQTPYSISKAYGVSVDELLRSNPGIEMGLKAGTVIRIPVVSLQTNSNDPFYEDYLRHKVKAGETIYGICREYGITEEQLMAANPALKHGLKVNDILRIPLQNSTSPKLSSQATVRDSIVEHEVQKKETLYSISKLYNVAIDDIIALNPGINEGLKKGQIIKLPYRAGAAGIFEVPTVEEPPVPTRCEIAPDHSYFRIALVLPLHLDKVSEIDVSYVSPAKINPKDYTSLNYIQFYEGFMMAIDTLQAKGMNLIVDVYDAPMDSVAFIAFLSEPNLLKANLIIGPEHSANLRSLSQFANRNKIYLLNPWFNHEMYILGSPYTLNLIPQVSTQLNQLCEYLLDSIPNANYIIVHDKAEKNRWVVDRLKESLSLELLSRGKPDSAFLVVNYPVAGMSGLEKHLDPKKQNVLITVAANEAFISSYVSRLNSLRDNYSITLVGMPWWRNFDRIETDYLQNLNLHLFSRYFIDYDDEYVNKFIAEFRTKYKVEPDPEDFLPFRAYDIGLYFGWGLYYYGTYPGTCFNEVPYSPMYTEFKLKNSPGSGFENQFVSIYKYKDYKLVEVNRK